MARNVLIVEDEPKILEFISSYIAHAGYNPIGATTAKAALDVFYTVDLDLILLDLMLPDMTGESVCATIRETKSTPIIMITAKTDEDSIIAGLEMGADDYITKPFSPRQLIARVKALFRRSEIAGNILISSREAQIGPFEVDLDQYLITYMNNNLNLTVTEFNLFETLLTRPTKVFTRDELALQIQNGQYEGYNRSIDSHIKNIRSKIADHTDCDYIKTIRGIGYQFNDC